MQYDLADRTKTLARNVISLLKNIKYDLVSVNIIDQLSRSITSVGANYCEANNACSKKDFINKIYFCKKEIQESKYWIEMLALVANEDIKAELRRYWQESHELSLIFNKIALSSRANSKIENSKIEN